MYAVFDNGGKQYKASVGDNVKIEKINAQPGDTVSFPVVMVMDDDGVKAGKEVEGMTVTCRVCLQDKDRKIIVFKYKPKKNERKKQGHRQPFTIVRVTGIETATRIALSHADVASEDRPADAEKSKTTRAPRKKAPAAETAETAEAPAENTQSEE